MFYRFNAHRTKKPENPGSHSDKLARKIADRITSLQKRWAAFMDGHARKVPVKWLKVLLIVSTLTTGSYCIYLLRNGIFSQATTRLEDINFRQLWPLDPFGQKEKLKKQSALGRYLDSLEREVRRDSLQNPQFYQP